MMKKIGVVFAMIAIGLSGCSSITTIEKPSIESADGLTYFMPKKDFLVKINVSQSKVNTVSLDVTPAYPDLTKQYVLKYKFNLFGENTLDVGVTEKGLLTSTKSDTISKVNEAFKNLASTAGRISTLGFLEEDVKGIKCTVDRDYIFIFDKPGKYTACDVNIEISEYNQNNSIVSHNKAEGEEHSGIFYRQNKPYLMKASAEGLNTESIVFSPSHSEVHFLPISKSFFADNSADFTFTDGIPTKYKQAIKSEFVSLFKLPADIIDGYFEGVGKIFDSFKTVDQKEGDALSQSLKLELTKMKYDLCIAAIKEKKDELIDQLGCSK